MRRPARAAAALLFAAAVTAAGCGNGDDDPTTLRVYAAASLSHVVADLAETFEAEHDVEVELVVGGSADLVTQVSEGAPADLVATADTATMARLVDAGLAEGAPRLIAGNTLQIVVPADNPASVATLADLGREELTVVVCAPQVPCGAASARLAEAAGVRLAPDSEEQAVTDVLGKVSSGEADAGLVYRTDVLAAKDAVLGIDVPQAAEVVNAYPAVLLADADHPEVAEEFLALLTGPTGRRTLAAAGFAPPPDEPPDEPASQP